MKKTFTFAALLIAALSLPLASFAKDTKPKGDKDPGEKFDTNHNGRIDKGPEADAIRAAYAAEKEGPLKKYDTNHNGELEAGEINSIKVPIKHGKK